MYVRGCWRAPVISLLPLLTLCFSGSSSRPLSLGRINISYYGGKETYYRGKRDLLKSQKRPTIEPKDLRLICLSLGRINISTGSFRIRKRGKPPALVRGSVSVSETVWRLRETVWRLREHQGSATRSRTVKSRNPQSWLVL